MAESKSGKFRFESIPIAGIIGAPLEAAANANAMMSKLQAEFILDYCFAKTKTESGDITFSPVMVALSLTRSVPGQSGKNESTTIIFNLPILTIIPISSLAIDSVNLSYQLQITSHTMKNKESSLTSNSSGEQDQKVELAGRISNERKDNESTRRTSSVDSMLKIDITAGQLPLPVGITSIIDLYSKAMLPVDQTPKSTVTK